MTNVLISAACAWAALGCGVASMWFGVRFYRNQYGVGPNKRRRDAVLSACLLGTGIGFAILAVAGYTFGPAIIAMLPFAVCLGIALIPVGVMGAYWRAYQIDGLFPAFPNGPVSARAASSEQGQGNSLPRPTESVAIAGMGIVVSVMSGAAIVYILVEPSTRGVSWVVVPILALIALVCSFGSIVWLWNIRKRESGL